MCGRFLFDADFDEVYNKLMVYERDFVLYKTDFRPSDKVPVILYKGEHNAVQEMQWGLRGYKDSQLLFNARRESLLQKPRFRQMTDNRCLVPATLFYETEHRGKERIPHTFGNDKILYLAGLYEANREMDRVTLITMEAEGDVKTIHSRMPIALEEEDLLDWLQGEKTLAYGKLLSQKPLYRRLDIDAQIAFF